VGVQGWECARGCRVSQERVCVWLDGAGVQLWLWCCRVELTGWMCCTDRPESEVWIIWGDGSCGYSVAEFDTYTRHKVPVVALVGNDAGWTQIEREQVGALPMAHADSLCDVAMVDFSPFFAVRCPCSKTTSRVSSRTATTMTWPVGTAAAVSVSDQVMTLQPS